MSTSILSQEVRRFILTNIPSVPYLEALLLLRDEPDSVWSSTSLAQRLYLSESGAMTLLAQLVNFGIVESQAPEEFRFRPRSHEMRRVINALALAYSKHLVEVSQLIHSKTDRQAQQFADAFKLRKDP